RLAAGRDRAVHHRAVGSLALGARARTDGRATGLAAALVGGRGAGCPAGRHQRRLPKSRSPGAFVLRGRRRAPARRLRARPIHLGPVPVQPSELFKLVFVLALTWALTSWRAPSLSRSAIFGTLILLGVPFVLVVRQPDLGTALVLVPVAVTILVGVGVRLRVL